MMSVARILKKRLNENETESTEEDDIWEDCFEKDVDEAGELLKTRYGFRFADEKIDDGTDEDGVYLMKRVYTSEDYRKDVLLYYLDTERIVTHIDFRGF